MSELNSKSNNRAAIRWRLLTGVSALALMSYASSGGVAHAEDADHPSVWIELGGQLSRLQNGQEVFSAPLMANRPAMFEPSENFETPPRSSIDEFGKLSFQPADSGWSFSASVQYGRSTSQKHEAQQTSPVSTSKYLFADHHGGKFVRFPVAEKFADTQTRNNQTHLILDFQVGKDVGLGMFGTKSTSTINLGIRFAQFTSASNFAFKSDPDWHFQQKYFDFPPYYYHLHFIRQPFHSNIASMTADRSFHGVGPSVSWNSSVPLVGSAEDGQIMADWGINVGLLFGRQKTRTHHQSTGRYGYTSAGVQKQTAVPQTTARFPATPDHMRSRRVTIPNLGGFAGLSFKYPNAKISFGYRADFFFGAMDAGIDARKTYDQGFYGPYASISIGLP